MPNQLKIALFGHFGAANFGNESTLQAVLFNVQHLAPRAEIACICTFPETVAADYHLVVRPMSPVVVKPTRFRNSIARLLRKLFVGIPSELYRWLDAVRALRGADMLIIVGTGLLTDAFSVGGWGPYSTFKWSVAARLCGCRVVFLSVGAGPLRGIGKRLAMAALRLADFRSYRDVATLEYLKSIGFRPTHDRLYPDLAFSLPSIIPQGHRRSGRRLVGLGLMAFSGMYGVQKTTSAHYTAYFETLVVFVKWLLDRDYDVRLLIGDLADAAAMEKFASLVRDRSLADEEGRVSAEPIASADELLSQLAATDFVVGTRFHNVLLALFLNKPSIAISFHHKCSSLMGQMGLSEYCQDIQQLSAQRLIDQFCLLEKNADSLRALIAEKVAACRMALDEQYRLILQDLAGQTMESANPASTVIARL